MRCLGYRLISFKPSGSQSDVTGYRCTFVEEYPKDVGTGFNALTQFLSLDKFTQFGIAELTRGNKEFSVYYNRYGKIQDIIEK